MRIIKYIFAKKHSKFFRGIALRLGMQAIMFGLGFNATFAESIGDAIQEKIYTYNSILNVLYLVLRPALTLAGMALDNSMVYGSFLNLDAPLRLIWNIVKNIANFALGFMVLFEILKNFFTTDQQGANAFKIIKKALIAGVLIQASWFLLAAVIDVSTILTYSIGGLPISALKTQCQDIGNTKILGVGSKIDFTTQNTDTTIDNSFMYYFYARQGDVKNNFARCEVQDNKWVVGQKYRGTVGDITFKQNYCILSNNQFAYFGEGSGMQIATDSTIIGQYDGLETVTDNQVYQTNLTILMEMTGNQELFSGWAAGGLIFNVWSGGMMTVVDPDAPEPGIYTLNAVMGSGIFVDVFAGAPALKDILDQAEGFVGVLITLYKSILNFSSFNTSSGSVDGFVMFLEILLKTAFGIAILVPLVITAIALIIRIGYMWMFIALSPIIALRVAFEGFGDNDGRIKSIIESIPIIGGDLSGILRIIFAPVLICFAVAICMLFMSVLITSLRNESPSACISDRETIRKSFNVNSKNPTDVNPNGSYEIGGITEIQQSAYGMDIQSGTKDIFGWFLINIFGAAMTWLILMTVIQIVFKGTPVGDWKLNSIAKNALGSMPIIPIPTKEGMQFIGAGTAAKLGGEAATMVNQKVSNISTEKARLLSGGDKPDTDAGTSSSTSNTTFVSAAPINDSDESKILAGGVATSGISGLDASDLFKDSPTLKGATQSAVQKAVITKQSVRTALIEETKADPTKQKDVLDKTNTWFHQNVSLFSKAELETLWKSDDAVARRLSPHIVANQETSIKAADGGFTVTFNPSTYEYEFTDKPDATNAFNTLLEAKPNTTDRTKSLAELM